MAGGASVTLTVTAVPPTDQAPPGDQGNGQDNGQDNGLLAPLFRLFGTPGAPGHGQHRGGG